MNRTAVVYALLSAALFGVSTPAAKGLVGTVDPIMLAGMLYCGAGIGVALVRRFARIVLAPEVHEQPLRRQDIPWLAGAIAAGGIAGPVLLMTGLARTDASAASLLLTLEGAATALMAWLIFRENFNRRVGFGMVLLVAGAVTLGWSGTPAIVNIIGPAAIVGACVAWGLDNNLTRKVSLADPLQIVELKGLIAGPVSVALGYWAGGSLPGASDMLLAGLVGFLGYGVSIVLFVMALRHLGAARTGAYFSTAPFLGAAAAVLALGEAATVQLFAAGCLMGLGIWLHLTERHEHEHSHQPMKHTHSHVHDDHHRHQHGPEDPQGEPHTHAHEHGYLKHTHPHTPDMHHQHRH
jgi:drug/metabolite transporter (DMT)-like permease